jgi:hypothetical protein
MLLPSTSELSVLEPAGQASKKGPLGHVLQGSGDEKQEAVKEATLLARNQELPAANPRQHGAIAMHIGHAVPH